MKLVSSTYMRNGNTYYAVTAEDREASEFQKLSDSWVEGVKKAQLSQDEIQHLKDNYNFGKMSSKDRDSLLGELVESGVISKKTAECIYNGLIPVASSIEDLDTKGRLAPSTPQYEQWSATVNEMEGRQKTGQDWLDYYTAFYNLSKHNTAMEVDESGYFSEYAAYLKVLGQLVG